MSKPFSDLALTDQELSSNYTWQQVKKTQEYIDSRVYVDQDRDILVVDNEVNDIDLSGGIKNLTICGTSIGSTGSFDTIVLGHNTELSNVDCGIIIGGDCLGTTGQVANFGDSIAIGHNLDCGDISGVTGAVLIGHDSVLRQGGHTVVVGNNNTQNIGGNILIGNNLVDDQINNTDMIILSNGLLKDEPQPGSIVFGGVDSHTGSTGARIQFLSEGLEDAGNAFTFPLNGGESDYAGFIPMKYKGTEIRVPFLNFP